MQACVQLQTIQHLQLLQRSRHGHHHSMLARLRRKQQHKCQAALRPLEVSSSIAAARAAESSRPDALFQDPYAAVLSGQQQQQRQPPSDAGVSAAEQDAAMDVIATRYMDESVLNAMDATNINSIQSGDYR
jgi:O-methyltransferase involved in polyketide biosynthesis